MNDNYDKLAQILCGEEKILCCPFRAENDGCKKFGKCRILQKTEEQLGYIFSPIDSNVYLKACAGSGKTEALGIKAAYEISCFDRKNSGIAVLTFTNAAMETIRDRIAKFYPGILPEKHYIGTVSGFIQGFITQKFAYKNRRVSKNGDMSFTLVDSETNEYKQRWLDNYKVPVFNSFPVYAHRLYKRLSDGKWMCREKYGRGNNGDRTLEDIYDGELKKAANYPKQRKYSYADFEQAVIDCKEKFYADGFATFEDMEYLALECLKNEKDVAHYLAEKFPVIMVDEFQDLSVAELKILGLIGEAGSCLHFIGDLNQAIYSFKDALPEELEKYLKDHRFLCYELSANFRSTQKIVDVSRAIGGITDNIRGIEKSLNKDMDALYIEYPDDNELEAVKKFTELVKKFNFKSENCVIAVRTNKHISELSGVRSEKDAYLHGAINAVNLWCERSIKNTDLALKLIGKQLQKWIGYHVRGGSYYCPKDFDGGDMVWKLKLRDILNAMYQHKELLDFENKKYCQWYLSNKKTLAKIICENLALPDITESTLVSAIKTPQGTSNNKIELCSYSTESEIGILSVHAIKGKTYDALMHVSYPNAHKSIINYWEHWIDGEEEEERRCAYVAATRPKYLLCWAVHTLSNEQREKIEKLGFVKYT